MPVFAKNSSYTGLSIKAPVTVRMLIPAQKIKDAKSKLGTTVGPQTVDKVVWELQYFLCPSDAPDCASPTIALKTRFYSNRQNNKWMAEIEFDDFYVTPSAKFTFDAYQFAQEQDTFLDVTFTDSQVTFAVNGRTLLQTDTLKKFAQIRQLTANSNFYDTAGNPLTVDDTLLQFNVSVMQLIDVGAILNVIIPLAVVGLVLGLVISLFRKRIPALAK